ncbi:MAG: NAD(P)-dependent oxidoreductase, partial [Halioglobus sp.]|nr:NAD(P)-dependent oxidoreductase [Halioglobus sp.]
MAAFDSAFVTGAGGFIGRHLVAALRQENVRVVALMLPGEAVPAEWGDAVRTVTGDIRSLLELKDDIGQVDVVFHLAAVVSDWGAQDEHVAITVGGTEQAIELALAWDAHFIVTTSVCAYASNLASGDITEETPIGSVSSPYEFCKQEQERVTRKAVGIHRLQASIVRPGNVYGVGSGPWVNTMLDMLRSRSPSLIGKGDWDAGLCHVRNLVALMLLLPG